MATQAVEVGSRRRGRFRLKRRRREYMTFLLLALPNLILLGTWVLWPFLRSLYLSLTNWGLLRPEYDIVGLSNFAMLARLPEFWKITRNSVTFAFGTVLIRLVLSLSLAVLLNQKLVARGLWRFIAFSPQVTTTAAMALVWMSMYDARYGVFANAFSLLGLKFPRVLGSAEYALPAIMLVAIWKSLGFSTVIFLAALQGVDVSQKEAAAIDGATAWQSFWRISFPAISPTTYFLLVTGLAMGFKTFDIVSVMTQGGPSNASNVYVYQVYLEAFVYNRMGVASALAVVMFVLLMAFTYMQSRIGERWVNY